MDSAQLNLACLYQLKPVFSNLKDGVPLNKIKKTLVAK
jgi:transcriptional antiterminator Rof (Rho-off)